MLQDYKVIILDASLFYPFSEQLKTDISKHNCVFLANSFNNEYLEYKSLLDGDDKQVLLSNYNFLASSVRTNVMNIDGFVSGSSFNDDIWGLMEVFLSKDIKSIVVTGSQLLLEKIVLKGMDIDIYDLQKDKIVTTSSFGNYRKKFSFLDMNNSKNANNIKISAGSNVFCENGKVICLGEEIKSGREGTIYRIKNQRDEVVKIFDGNKLELNKLEYISKLIDVSKVINVPWAIFPRSIIYADSNCTIPMGIVEEYMDSKIGLDQIPIYVGNPEIVEGEYLDTKMSFTIDLALKVVRQVSYLNSHGLFISDFNFGNFALSKNEGNNYIYMCDTDSFGYNSYFSQSFSPEYKEGTVHPKYNFTNKKDVFEACEDALYQFVFELFSLGDTPFSEMNGGFKYSNKDYWAKYCKKFFPSLLWEHFEEVFSGKRNVSTNYLLSVLHEIQTYYSENREVNKTIRYLYTTYVDGYKEPNSHTLFEEEEDFDFDLTEEDTIDIPLTNIGYSPVSKNIKILIRVIVVGIVFLFIVLVWWIFESNKELIKDISFDFIHNEAKFDYDVEYIPSDDTEIEADVYNKRIDGNDYSCVEISVNGKLPETYCVKFLYETDKIDYVDGVEKSGNLFVFTFAGKEVYKGEAIFRFYLIDVETDIAWKYVDVVIEV